MTTDKDNRKMNPKSLANLDPKARLKGVKRVNVTLSPEIHDFLKSSGNCSQMIEDLTRKAMIDLAKGNPSKKGLSDDTHNLIARIDQLEKVNKKLIQEQQDKFDLLNQHLEDEIRSILEKHANGSKGYRHNGFSQGIKDLKSLLIDLS